MNIKIEHIRENLLTMASLTEKAISCCTNSEVDISEQRELENEINAFHKLIDDECFKYIALMQPMARDLREVISMMKINSDLERVGDQAVNIKRTVRYLKNLHPLLTTLQEEVHHMLHNAIDALIQTNTMLSIDVIKTDETINGLHRSIIKNYIKLMKENNIEFDEAYNVIQISKNFERVGDHAKNIAEDIIFIDKGKDIRHGGDKEGLLAKKEV